MSPGWLLDNASGGRGPLQWVEGEHEVSAWTGSKIRGRAVYATESLRCDACGAVRLYARTRKR